MSGLLICRPPAPLSSAGCTLCIVDPQLRARDVCELCAVQVHVRAHGPIGTATQPTSSRSAWRLTAGPNSTVSCSIRHGLASGLRRGVDRPVCSPAACEQRRAAG
eukprot:5873559-Prymnesium_polylepis.1